MKLECMICGAVEEIVLNSRIEEKFYAKAVELGWTVGLPKNEAWCPRCSKVALFRQKGGPTYGAGPH